MPLKEISKENSRKPREFVKIPPGPILQMYMPLSSKIRLNNDLVMEILEKCGIDTDNNDVHRIKMMDGKFHYVNDAGLAELTS